MPEISSFLIILSIAWALLYWIFGGVVFSIISVLRVGRVRKARFGCLFTLLAAGLGAVAAFAGTRLADRELAACQLSTELWQSWIEQFACGIVWILGAWILGFILLLLISAILLSISKQEAPAWIKPSKPEESQEE